jgi:hypothetical protein
MLVSSLKSLCCLYDIIINENCTGQNDVINVANKFLEEATELKYLEKKLEKIKFGECLLLLHSEYSARPLLFRNVEFKERRDLLYLLFPWV